MDGAVVVVVVAVVANTVIVVVVVVVAAYEAPMDRRKVFVDSQVEGKRLEVLRSEQP